MKNWSRLKRTDGPGREINGEPDEFLQKSFLFVQQRFQSKFSNSESQRYIELNKVLQWLSFYCLKLTYKFSAYNVVTGNVPASDVLLPVDSNVNRKSHRKRTKPPVRSDDIDEKDGPMSHQDYIEKRRLLYIYIYIFK